MQMIYNSPTFCVVEFAGAHATDMVVVAQENETPPINHSLFVGGYEIMDKLSRREIFLAGELALHFRERVSELIDGEPTMEEIDDFLGGFSALMQQPVVMH